MDLTVHKYTLVEASKKTTAFASKLSEAMTQLAFHGEETERQFGFAHCGCHERYVYGLFIQKYPTILTDYDSKTKEETHQKTIDTGEYFFLIDVSDGTAYLQSRRSGELPSTDEIEKRFSGLLKLAFGNVGNYFSRLEKNEEKIDRSKILKIFYEIADDVYELELEDFDVNLIEEEKKLRGGKRQTYFNPREEYQEAMEEGAKKLAQHVDNARIKAKKGESLKKDPIARCMLEGSRKPVKITYSKDDQTVTESGTNKVKEVLKIEGDAFDLSKQIKSILEQLGFSEAGKRVLLEEDKPKTDKGSPSLFDL